MVAPIQPQAPQVNEVSWSFPSMDTVKAVVNVATCILSLGAAQVTAFKNLLIEPSVSSSVSYFMTSTACAAVYMMIFA